MSRVVFLSCILWASVGLGGQLTGGERPETLPRQVGTVVFPGDDAVITWVGMNALNTATSIAYLDLYGTASRMDLASMEMNEKGSATGNLLTVLSAQPEDLGDGWTRFSFRGLGARTEARRGPAGWYYGFGEGSSMRVILHDGQYPVLDGSQFWIDENGNGRNYGADYYRAEDGQKLIIDMPLIVPTRETLDPPFGDATKDGRIDINDFGLLKDGFGQPTTPYENGEVTGNLSVDMADFGILKQNFGWRQSAVPEPSAFGLLGLGIVLFALRKIVPRVMVR